MLEGFSPWVQKVFVGIDNEFGDEEIHSGEDDTDDDGDDDNREHESEEIGEQQDSSQARYTYTQMSLTMVETSAFIREAVRTPPQTRPSKRML